jgi:MYXO-CTERM domain-containing protein
MQLGDMLALSRASKPRAFLRVLSVSLVPAAATLLASVDARADSCTSPDLVETIPDKGAQSVPTNALLFARYETIAQYQNEPIGFEHVGMGTSGVSSQSVTFDATSGILQITPPTPLLPGDSYVVHWPALRGIDTATLGRTMNQNLTAGSEADMLPPTFEGLTSISWDVSRTQDSCTSAIDERYVFDLGIGDAADDGGRDSLTLIVFQTSGPTLEASARTQVLAQRIPPPGQHVQVTSSIGNAVGHICFAAIVRDLTLKVSFSGAPLCVDTVAPPFFYGCGVAPAKAGSDTGVAAMGLLAVAMGRLARKRTLLSSSVSALRRQGAGDR